MRRQGFRLAAALMATLAICAVHGLSRSLTSAAAIEVPEAAATAQPNVLKTNVWAGLYGNYFNGPFTSVTICRSGTTNCETISGIQILRNATPGGFSVRVTLYGTADKKIADRAISCVQREKRRHFHLND